MSRTKRLIQCVLNRPASSKPALDLERSDATLLRPVCKDLSPSVVCDLHIVPFIAGLFLRRNPLAVTRFIIAIVVLSLNLVAFVARTHISEKLFERIFPSPAHSYPTASIMFPSGDVRVAGAVLYTEPHLIFRSFLSLSAVPVTQAELIVNFWALASAGNRVATQQVVMENNHLVATDASTLLFVSFYLSAEILKNSKFAENASSKVHESRVCGEFHLVIMDSLTETSRTL